MFIDFFSWPVLRILLVQFSHAGFFLYLSCQTQTTENKNEAFTQTSVPSICAGLKEKDNDIAHRIYAFYFLSSVLVYMCVYVFM